MGAVFVIVRLGAVSFPPHMSAPMLMQGRALALKNEHLSKCPVTSVHETPVMVPGHNPAARWVLPTPHRSHPAGHPPNRQPAIAREEERGRRIGHRGRCLYTLVLVYFAHREKPLNVMLHTRATLRLVARLQSCQRSEPRPRLRLRSVPVSASEPMSYYRPSLERKISQVLLQRRQRKFWRQPSMLNTISRQWCTLHVAADTDSPLMGAGNRKMGCRSGKIQESGSPLIIESHGAQMSGGGSFIFESGTA